MSMFYKNICHFEKNCGKNFASMHDLLIHIETNHIDFNEPNNTEPDNNQIVTMSSILPYSSIVKSRGNGNDPAGPGSCKTEVDLLVDRLSNGNPCERYEGPIRKKDTLKSVSEHSSYNSLSAIKIPIKKYQCPVNGCPKSYKNQNGMRYHVMNSHDCHGNFIKPKKDFKCQHCSKEYKTSRGLQMHATSHNNSTLMGASGSGSMVRTFTVKSNNSSMQQQQRLFHQGQRLFASRRHHHHKHHHEYHDGHHGHHGIKKKFSKRSTTVSSNGSSDGTGVDVFAHFSPLTNAYAEYVEKRPSIEHFHGGSHVLHKKNLNHHHHQNQDVVIDHTSSFSFGNQYHIDNNGSTVPYFHENGYSSANGLNVDVNIGDKMAQKSMIANTRSDDRFDYKNGFLMDGFAQSHRYNHNGNVGYGVQSSDGNLGVYGRDGSGFSSQMH